MQIDNAVIEQPDTLQRLGVLGQKLAEHMRE